MEQQELKILLVEDALADAELCERELRQGGFRFTSMRVDRLETYTQALESFRPDLILSDFSLPAEFDGLLALEIAREKLPDVPFIFISGTIGEDRAVEAMKSGATDYVLKDRPQRLVPVVRRALQEAEDRARRRETERALHESQERFRVLLEAAPDAIALVDPDGRIVLVNARMEELFGYSRVELFGQPVELLVPEGLPPVEPGASARHLELQRAPPAEPVASLGRRSDGSAVPLDVSLSPIEIEGRPHVIGVIRDVTRRLEQELKIARLNRIRNVLGAINSAIVRIRDRQDLFEEVCRIAVDEGGFAVAWIGLLDPESLAVRPVAYAGGGAETWLGGDRDAGSVHAPLDSGVVGQAIRNRHVVISNDLTAETTPGGDLRQEAIRQGYRSIAALPLLIDDASYGVFSLFARDRGAFNDEEVRLLTELAGDISFALDSIEKAERLNYLAYHDALTGLPNLALICERLDQALSDAEAHGSRVAVLVADVRRFRWINESLGRHFGDALLRELGQRLRGFLRDPSNVARLSGDCFAGVLSDVRDVNQIGHLLEQPLADLVAEPFLLDGKPFAISLTVGVAISPGDGRDSETLLRNAEAAVKKAKLGNERYLFYEPAMNASVAHTLLLENRMRRALEERQFVLHYQPTVRLADESVSGAEALIRWLDPETGLVPPGQFISILEESGLILEAGEWALRQALSDCRTWTAPASGRLRVAVNVSAAQLRHRDFVESVLRAVEECQADAELLELEITESLIMDDIEANIPKLRSLRSRGIRLAIDDFGTGYSSLSYLAKLPVNTLKIDRSFIQTILEEPESRALVSSMLSLARSLKLDVVAEGVETPQQAGLLRDLACNEAQGFLFSRPLPNTALRQYLAAG